MTISPRTLPFARLLLASLVLGAASLSAQQPLRVSPTPVVLDDSGAAVPSGEVRSRGSFLSTSILQVSPANPVLPSSPVNYRIRISNFSNSALSGVSVALTASGALTLQTVDPALTCDGTSFAARCTLNGSVPPGTNSRELVFTALTPPASAINPPQQSFVLGAAATVDGLGIGSETVTTVTVARDFSVSGTASPAAVIVGQGFSYTINVSNGGPFTADWAGAQVTVALPTQVRYRPEANQGPFSCAGSTAPGSLIACTYNGPANGGTTQSLTLGAEAVSAATAAAATLSVSAPADPNTGNNTSSAGVSIAPAIASVNFVKNTLTPSPANPTQPVDFQLSVSAASSNNVPLSGLSVIDTLPNGLIFAGVQSGAPAWSCSGSGQSVSCLLGQTLTAGTSAPALVLRTTPQSGVAGQTLTNQATISSSQIAPSVAQSTVSFGTAVDAAATLIASQNPVASGAAFSYLLGISAAGTIPIGAAASLELPSNLILNSVLGGSGWSCAASGQTVNCNRTTAAVNVTPTAEIRVTAPVVGNATTLTAAANATLPNNFDPSPAPTILQVTVSAAAPVVELSKSGPTSVIAGSEFEYLLQVRNAGAFPVNSLRVRDPLPPGLGLLSINGASCSVIANVVDCPLSLAAGASQTITLRVVAPAEVGSITNTARAEFGEEGFVESSVQTTIVAASRPDVAVRKSVDLEQVRPGGRLNYVITVTNIGNLDAQGVELSDVLPGGVTLVSTSPASCQGGSVVRCNLGALAVGATQTVSVVVDVSASASGVLTNVARVAATGDENPTNDEASASTRVEAAVAVPMADLLLTAQVTPPTYAGVAADLVFRANLRNLGPDPAQAVQLSVLLPASGVVVQSANFGGQPCALAAGSGSCSLGTLGSGAQVEGEVRVRVSSAIPQVAVRFGASSSTMDPVLPNNGAEAIATLAVSAPLTADLVLALNGPAQTRLGEQFSLSAALRNEGPESVAGVRLVGSLPTALRFISAAGPASCAQTGQELRCDLTGSLSAGEQRIVTLTLAAQNNIGAVTASFAASGNLADPRPINNTVTYALNIGTPGDDDVIEQLLSDITDVFARDAIPTVADICANPPADLAAQCDAIIRARLNGDIAGATRGLRALFPEEVLSQALSANQLAATQFTNVDARMSELRGGAGGFSISGLTVQVGQQSIPLSIFKGFGQSEEEPAVGGSGDLISPWGGFINGTISFGDQSINARERNTVADFDSYSLTAGVDYRRSARLVFGGALGWNRFQSNLSDEGRLDTKGWTLTTYGSWYPLERWYLDGRVSYGRLDFAMQRRILIPGVVDRLAQGNTDGTQYAVALATGYHYNRGGWSITPNASLRYADTTYDPFAETGAGANNASFSENSGKSLQASFGLSISRAFSLSNGVLLPQFDISMNREMRNQNLLVEAELLGAPGNVFRVRSDDQDRTFGSVGLGFVFVMANGRQAYLSYRELFGLDGLSRGSVNLGGRFEF